MTLGWAIGSNGLPSTTTYLNVAVPGIRLKGVTSINIEAGRVKLFTVNAACIVISVKVKIRIHDVGHTFYLFRFDI